ncbi:MAG: hydrolase [Bacteroidetes bacterium]|nr:hydrolase [Bacteroidota bacterium]
MRINPNNVACLVIDFQERIFPAIHEHEKLSRTVPILLEGLKTLEIPIFVTEQYVKGLGQTVPEIARSIEGINRIEKSSFSCCDEPRFMLELANSGKDNVIVCGIESHVCVLQTVIDLKQHGYHPIVVEDCISSRKENDKKIALLRMQQEGAIITTYEAILFELLRRSGGETFKAISKLVK